MLGFKFITPSTSLPPNPTNTHFPGPLVSKTTESFAPFGSIPAAVPCRFSASLPPPGPVAAEGAGEATGSDAPTATSLGPDMNGEVYSTR